MATSTLPLVFERKWAKKSYGLSNTKLVFQKKLGPPGRYFLCLFCCPEKANISGALTLRYLSESTASFLATCSLAPPSSNRSCFWRKKGWKLPSGQTSHMTARCEKLWSCETIKIRQLNFDGRHWSMKKGVTKLTNKSNSGNFDSEFPRNFVSAK